MKEKDNIKNSLFNKLLNIFNTYICQQNKLISKQMYTYYTL